MYNINKVGLMSLFTNSMTLAVTVLSDQLSLAVCIGHVFDNVWLAWNHTRSNTKKGSGKTVKKPLKVSHNAPYHAAEKCLNIDKVCQI